MSRTSMSRCIRFLPDFGSATLCNSSLGPGSRRRRPEEHRGREAAKHALALHPISVPSGDARWAAHGWRRLGSGRRLARASISDHEVGYSARTPTSGTGWWARSMSSSWSRPRVATSEGPAGATPARREVPTRPKGSQTC
jgi:hypothetical protein